MNATKPSILPVNVGGTPGKLKERRQWVLWKTVIRNDEKTKAPFQAWGTAAKSNDKATWDSFDAIVQASSSGKWEGVGYVFTESDPYCGIDLDGCRDPESGGIAGWAEPIIARLDTYCEVSPSGSGVKLWIRGKSPFATGKNLKLEGVESMGGKAAGIEIYDHKRFFCVTGQRLESTPATIEHRDIGWLKDQFWPEPKQKQACHEGNGHGDGSSSDVVARARKYADAVDPAVSGQGGHNTTFRLACALVNGFDMGVDGARPILAEYSDRCLPPWGEQELEHKLASAANQPGERGYLLNGRPDPNGPDRAFDWDSVINESHDTAQPENRPERKKYDLPEIESLPATREEAPPRRASLITGVLRQGHKLLMSGPSKAGKSFSLIQLCAAIAEGRQWLGWDCTQGRVLYVNLELDRASCIHRFFDVYDALGWEREHFQTHIDLWNLRGQAVPMDLLTPRLIERAKEKRYTAVIIDPIYKVITGDENAADKMAHFCNQFDKVCHELQAAVIYCHHHSKGAQGGKRSMDRASGSGVFARDPDALLDLIELPVSEDLRKQQENTAVCGLVAAVLDRERPGWRDGVSDDDMLSESQMRQLGGRLLGDAWNRVLPAIVDCRRAIGRQSAWRVEGTFREFPSRPPTDIWFKCPRHVLDVDGVLQDVEPEDAYRRRPTKQPSESKAKEDATTVREMGEIVLAMAEKVERGGGVFVRRVYELTGIARARIPRLMQMLVEQGVVETCEAMQSPTHKRQRPGAFRLTKAYWEGK